MAKGVSEALNERVKSNFDMNNLVCMFSIPIEKHVVKKNKRPIWRGRIGKSRELIAAENYLELVMKQQASQQDFKKPIDFPVWVIFHFYFTKDRFYTKQSKYKLRSKTLPDLSNLYEIVQDTLQGAGVIENDNLIDSHDLSRRLVGDANKLEIFILKMPGADLG